MLLIDGEFGLAHGHDGLIAKIPRVEIQGKEGHGDCSTEDTSVLWVVGSLQGKQIVFECGQMTFSA